MSLALLKFSGGPVHDYATISDDSPNPSCASRHPEGSDERRHIVAPVHPTEPLGGFEHPGGDPAKHHRPAAPPFHIPLHMARAAEETFNGVRGGQRSLEALRQTQVQHSQRVVEAFADARGCTRVVGVQAPSQVPAADASPS